LTRILYIDDDEGLRILVKRGLEREGYDVETATSGADGIARAAKGGIDVIATDHYMPEMDGLETLARLRELPEAPPVVFVTAAEEGRIAVAAMKAGAADYVIKDVRGEFIPLLKVAIDSALRSVRLRRARDTAEAELRASRDRYAALAAERELLLREVNHRVGNSLQLVAAFLHMQSASTVNTAVRDALVIAMGRVVAVGHVHRRLYTSEEVQSVCIAQYLASFVEDLTKTSPKATKILLDADAVELDPDRAIAVGVIVNELVLNALKYAYPNGTTGPIRIGFKWTGEKTVMLTVEDDGVGYDVKSASGLGGRIVKAMATKLGGKVKLVSKAHGTRIAIEFVPSPEDSTTEPHNAQVSSPS
jgi:two-component sensor histidine kinase/CheY-like chemotaxis protein